MNSLEESVNYLEGAIFNMKNKFTEFDEKKKYEKAIQKEKLKRLPLKTLSISSKMMKLRFLCKMNLQLCAVYSQINKLKNFYIILGTLKH